MASTRQMGKVGVVGVGAVGTACAKAMILRGSCHELVLLDQNARRARGVEIDLSHGSVLCPASTVRSGSYADLGGASVVVVTAGINERAGGAVDRKDKRGRLRLLKPNARTYREIIPRISEAAPDALILVVTDPPDPLADVARKLTKNPVVSAGTYLDSIRFRLQIGRRLNCHPSSVDAMVIGEHGTSQVYVWSSARVGGESVLKRVSRDGLDTADFRADVEKSVRYANIDIIEGTGASQHGIGIVTARIVEAIIRDEGLVAPVGVLQPDYGVTLSLPSVIDGRGVAEVLHPKLSKKEREALASSAAAIQASLKELDQLIEKPVPIDRPEETPDEHELPHEDERGPIGIERPHRRESRRNDRD